MITHQRQSWVVRLSPRPHAHTHVRLFRFPPSLGHLTDLSTSAAPSLQTALAWHLEAQAHRQTYHLKFVIDVQIEADLLTRREVDDVVQERTRVLERCVHGKRRQWCGSTVSQLQRQSPLARALHHAPVADIHVQEVGSRAVDVDSVSLSNHTHLVLAADFRKRQCLVVAAT